MDEAWKLVLWILLAAISGVIGTKASVAFDRGIKHVSEILRARRERDQQQAWGDAALLASESQALLIWLGQILLAVLALLSLSLSALCLGLLGLFTSWIQQLPIAFAGIGLLLTALAAVRGTNKLELVLVQPIVQILLQATSEALGNGRGKADHPSGIKATLYREEVVPEER